MDRFLLQLSGVWGTMLNSIFQSRFQAVLLSPKDRKNGIDSPDGYANQKPDFRDKKRVYLAIHPLNSFAITALMTGRL
jgi:hypothetical protein